MKKLICALMVFAMLIPMSVTAFASDLEIRPVGGQTMQTYVYSLSDMQLGESYTIPGYARLTPSECLFVDFFAQFQKDANYFDTTSWSRKADHPDCVFINPKSGDFRVRASWMDSGKTAEFLWLTMNVTNLQKKGVDFTKDNVTVRVIYDNEYEFEGWIRQFNPDHFDPNYKGFVIHRGGFETKCPNMIVQDPANTTETGVMYTETYIFGATLPNTVVEDTHSSLKMIITMNGVDATFYIR